MGAFAMIEVTIESLDWNDYKQNALPRAMTDSLTDSGQKWIRQELPRRFAVGAARRYGWPPRTKGYMLRKAKQKGHQRDMEYTGTLKRTALGGATARGQVRSVRVRILIPTTFARNHRGQTGMSLRDQMHRTNRDDLALMVDSSRVELNRRLAEDPKYRIKNKRKRKL